MDQCTQNYECLVINNATQSNRLDECIFWYKANLHGDFRLGAPEFWAHSRGGAGGAPPDEFGGGGDSYNGQGGQRLKGPTIQVRKTT